MTTKMDRLKCSLKTQWHAADLRVAEVSINLLSFHSVFNNRPEHRNRFRFAVSARAVLAGIIPIGRQFHDDHAIIRADIDKLIVDADGCEIAGARFRQPPLIAIAKPVS